MGLAASQARFLNLTARKTNIEYEAQQINQQRTVLANQSANTYNQMLTLSVPTPPSETAFQTIKYGFTYKGDPATINQVVKNQEAATKAYDYKVSITYSETVDDIKDAGEKLITKDDSGKAFMGSTQLVALSTLSSELDVDGVVEGVKNAAGLDNLDSAGVMVAVKASGTTKSYTYFLTTKINDIPKKDKDDVTAYTEQSYPKYTETVIAANITRDANNRITSISYENSDDVVVTSSTIIDQVAYDDAMNEYNYQTYLYQQEMENINAQTSVIQAQDKKLELRLKQLDTEQNAIKTEMESVSSVVKKNVEDTFKIFA